MTYIGKCRITLTEQNSSHLHEKPGKPEEIIKSLRLCFLFMHRGKLDMLHTV
jgi:hypothetical protein